MNKLGLLPILSIIVIASLSAGIFLDTFGIFQNQDPAMTITNINLETNTNSFTSFGHLTVTADAIFNEDLKSISMNGTLHYTDGTYRAIDLSGKPINGVKGQQYKLEYFYPLYLSPESVENIDYFELTIKTVSEDGVSKEINLNITSNGTIISEDNELDDLNSSDNNPDDNSNNSSDSKTNNKKNSTEKTPPKEPKPPSDNSKGSGGTGGAINNNNNNNNVNVVTRGNKSSG